MKARRVLVLGGLASSLVRFRGSLLADLVSRGHEVHVAAPSLSQDASTTTALALIGVSTHDIQMQRAGLNPVLDLASVLSFVKLMRTVRPDVVMAYTVKPVVYGLLAARLAGVRERFALITGLGLALADRGGGLKVLGRLVERLYREALREADTVFFQNPDDEAFFIERGLVPAGTRTVRINGSGVDTDHFVVAPFPPYPIRFLLVARLLKGKGIEEYVAAARLVRDVYPSVSFRVVGWIDDSPDAIPERVMKQWHSEGVLNWYGPLEDVRPAIAASHVFVLPSYSEGTPRSVLEAMSMGRPVITTDVPGCRETVEDGAMGLWCRSAP